MTILETVPSQAVPEQTSAPPVVPAPSPAPAPAGAGLPEPAVLGADERPPVPVGRAVVAASLGTAAAAVVAGGLFRGELARAVALLAGAAGAGLVGLAAARGRVILQYLLAPAAVIGGYLVAIVLPNSTGIRGRIPDLVHNAISNGGLSRPPIPFDPGWRFLIVTLFLLLGGAAVSLAVGFGRSRLTLAVPLPLVIAGALDQPSGQEVVAGVLALALLVGGLTVTFGAELSGSGEVSRQFQVRQTLRGVAATGLASILLVLLAQVGVLFPTSSAASHPQPQKPKIVKLNQVRDRPLFEVRSPLSGPWRLGVLDTYQDSGWLLPAYDPSRLRALGPGGTVPGAPRPGVVSAMTVRDVGGFTLPSAANPLSVTGAQGQLGYDPETQLFRVEGGAPPDGYSYRVTSAAQPTGADLTAAAALGVDPAAKPYLSVPSPPVAVAALLAKAPSNPFEKVQFLRDELYKKVLASGGGVPVDINPARVVALLGGAEGSPFEIVASEALLARWAGVPSRIGYGFSGGTPIASGTQQFRPRDGADWVELNLKGLGWVPIVGTPPRAKDSLDSSPKNRTAITRPSGQTSIKQYLPVENADPQLFFQIVRYYFVRTAPGVLAVVLAWLSVPALAKQVRRRRRAAWALTVGPPGQIAVAYAELRDLARDLAVDDGATTPLGFLDVVVDDEEHAELAWLTTRALWGDLTRGVTADDAAAAGGLSRSLQRRLGRAQSGLTRLSAAVNRASLREPYDPALPNAWRAPRSPAASGFGRARAGALAGRVRSAAARRRPRPA